jgi:hypothetical protein
VLGQDLRDRDDLGDERRRGLKEAGGAGARGTPGAEQLGEPVGGVDTGGEHVAAAAAVPASADRGERLVDSDVQGTGELRGELDGAVFDGDVLENDGDGGCDFECANWHR